MIKNPKKSLIQPEHFPDLQGRPAGQRRARLLRRLRHQPSERPQLPGQQPAFLTAATHWVGSQAGRHTNPYTNPFTIAFHLKP